MVVEFFFPLPFTKFQEFDGCLLLPSLSYGVLSSMCALAVVFFFSVALMRMLKVYYSIIILGGRGGRTSSIDGELRGDGVELGDLYVENEGLGIEGSWIGRSVMRRGGEMGDGSWQLAS